MGCCGSRIHTFETNDSFPGQDDRALNFFCSMGIFGRDLDLFYSAFLDIDSDNSGVISIQEFMKYFSIKNDSINQRIFCLFENGGSSGVRASLSLSLTLSHSLTLCLSLSLSVSLCLSLSLSHTHTHTVILPWVYFVPVEFLHVRPEKNDRVSFLLEPNNKIFYWRRYYNVGATSRTG